MRKILAGTICFGAAALAVACSGTARETPTPTQPASTPPWFTSASAVAASMSASATAAVASDPAEFPVALAYEDQSVWDFVRRWQGANISPILHPTSLPPGFDTVTIDQSPNKRDRHLLSVEYSGPGKTLRVLAGGINPPPPGPGGHEEKITVRGHDAVMVVNPETNPGGGIWVWWTEPATWVVQDGGPTIDHILYDLSATGFAQEELLRVAGSLTGSGE